MLHPVALIFIQSSLHILPQIYFQKRYALVPAVVGYVTGAEASYIGHTIEPWFYSELSYEFNRDAQSPYMNSLE